MSNVTVVCCYNNENMYKNLVKSLEEQNYPFEVIGIDNRGNKNFKSCASAYNSIINKVSTKYIIYSHQDILFYKPGTFAKFMSYLEKLGSHDILGVAGVNFDENKVKTNILHIQQEKKYIDAGDEYIHDGIIECDTVDECFFAGQTEHFKKFPFDEIICNNWHFYAVEACLRTRSNYTEGGGHTSATLFCVIFRPVK